MAFRKEIWIWAAGAVAAAALGWGMLPKPMPVETARVERGLFEEAVEEDGKTRVRERYTVCAPSAGHLFRSRFKAGDAVEPGEVLGLLSPQSPALLDVRSRKELQARLGAAEAAAERAGATAVKLEAAHRFAEEEQARLERLAAEGAVSPQALDRAREETRAAAKEWEAAQAGLHGAAHEVDQARAALSGAVAPPQERREVRSPVRGQVLKVFRESEGVVQAGEPLFDLADPQDLEVVVDMLSQDATRVRPGMEAELRRWGGSAPLLGKVRRVEPSAVTKVSALGVEEQRVNVLIDFTSAPEALKALGDGYRVEARILVRRTQGALRAPLGALFRDGDGWAVYVADGGRARKRAVRPGPQNAQEFQVEAGLSEGERVVLYPGDEVRDGGRIEIR